MKNQEYNVVTDTRTNSDPIPSLHALEVSTSPNSTEAGKVLCLREASPSENSYVVLPGEMIPFENYIDIQADLLYLKFFEVVDKILPLDTRIDSINYVIDVSGPSKASTEKLFYSTRTPEEIRPITYGYISCDDFYNLYTKEDFSYGIHVEISDEETSGLKDLGFILRCLPWPILNVSADDEKLSLLLKVPNLEFRPSPKKVLDLITYCHKRVSLVLGMLDIKSFRLVLLDLQAEGKKHELLGA